MPQNAPVAGACFLFAQVAAGALIFFAVARALALDELSLAWHAILARFERNVLPPETGEAPIG